MVTCICLVEGNISYPLSCLVITERHLSECQLPPAAVHSLHNIAVLAGRMVCIYGCALTAMTKPQLATGPQKWVV